MTAELIALTEELHATTQMLGRVLVRLDEADRRANRHRLWTGVLAGCVVAVLLLGLWTLSIANDSQDTLDEIRISRDESRAVSCRQDNDTAERINGLNGRTRDLLRDAIAGRGDRTPEEQAAAEAFLADQLAKYEALIVPLRDCTPAGIRAYFGGNP